MKKKMLFIFIILIAITVRIYNFPNVINDVNQDEVLTAINAEAIVATGKSLENITYPVYLNCFGGQSVMLLYLMAASIKLFGFSLMIIRLPSLIISIISLFVFYDFMKKLVKNDYLALFALFLLAISPWHILQSQWSLDCNLFPHFLLFALDFLVTGISKKKKYLIFIAIVFFALSLYCYGLAIFFVPIFLILIGSYLFKKKLIKIKDILLCSLLFLIIALPIIITFIINLFHLKSIMFLNITLPYYHDLSRTNDIVFFSTNPLKQLILNFTYLLKNVFFQSDWTIWNSSKYFGTSYLISNFFIIIGLVSIIRKKNFILLSWLSAGIVTSLIINNSNINQLNYIWYLSIILSVIGVFVVFNKIKFKKIFVGVLIFLYTLLFSFYNYYFYTTYANEISSSETFSNGFYQAILYAKKNNIKKFYYFTSFTEVKESAILRFTNSCDNSYRLENKKELPKIISNLKEKEAVILNYQDISNYKELRIEKYQDYVVLMSNN